MADQKFNVSCGFFDSVNGDRLYSADQMNRPYYRLVSNGIFAAPDASPSEDFKVVPSSGMGIIIKAGSGIFADKWLESAADIAITVPSNNSGTSRKDSVIIQVDKTVPGRTGNIVYRTGGQSFPDINADPNIVEYRVANLTIPPLVSAIAAGMIEDLRGSECPWIKSLIYQPDNAARIDEFIASYGVSNGTKITEDVLWSSPSPVYEPPQVSTGVELAHSMADYEYIDIRYTAFGKTGIVRFKPADISAYSATADHLSHFSEFERNVQIDVDTQSTPLVKIDFMIMKVSNTKLTWSVAGWVWDGKDSTSGKAANIASTTSDPIGLLSATGTKYEEAGTAKDPELADIRVGVGGVTYPTAGDAVREQIESAAEDINNLDSELADICVGADGTVYPTPGDAVRGQIESVQAAGISSDVKTALLNCFQHVAWVDNEGQSCYDALSSALNYTMWAVQNVLSGCSTSNQQTGVQKDNAYSAIIAPDADYTLDDADVSVVMGGVDITSSVYSTIGSNARISISQVTGDLTITITAVQLAVTSISASFNQGSNVITTENSLDDLREYLTVTANYSDSTSRIVTNYSLSGTLTEGTSTITVSYSGKSTTFNVLVSSPLPAGYTRLEYVSANGLQYINSGINEAQTTHAKYKVRITSTPTHNGNHILSSVNTYFPFLKFYETGKTTTILGIKFRGAELPSVSDRFSWRVNTVYEIEGFVNGNAVMVDGTQVKELSAGSTFSSSNDLYFFAYGGNVSNLNYRFNGDLFEAKIYGENDTLLRNYIPCKNSSNVAGLYDTVSETFYSSQSGTELIAGEVA